MANVVIVNFGQFDTHLVWLNSNKAGGPEGIDPKLLRLLLIIITPSLTGLEDEILHSRFCLTEGTWLSSKLKWENLGYLRSVLLVSTAFKLIEYLPDIVIQCFHCLVETFEMIRIALWEYILARLAFISENLWRPKSYIIMKTCTLRFWTLPWQSTNMCDIHSDLLACLIIFTICN